MTRTLVRDTLHLLSPRLQSFRIVARGRLRAQAGRSALLLCVTAVFWLLAFGVTFRLLGYFKNVPEMGALLAGRLLGLVLLSFLGLLLFTSVVTSLSTFFLARDLDLIAAAPVHWLSLYSARLAETLVNSSWMVLLMATPVFTAYGVVYDGGWWYPLVALAAMIPFIVIPVALGAALTLLLVNVFPARRARSIMVVASVLVISCAILAFRVMRPERLAHPGGYRSLADFLVLLRAPTSPWLPSDLAQSAVLGWLRYEPTVLPFVALWAAAAGLVIVGALLHRSLYAAGLSKSQQGATGAARRTNGQKHWRSRCAVIVPTWILPATRRELVIKELRVFMRDTTQWSQLILLIVLAMAYVINIRYLPLRSDGLTFFLANIIPFLNLGLAGFVLASVAARLIFPSVSLEGRTWWLLKTTPLAMRDLLWAKFWVGTVPLLVLALTIVLATDVLLQVSAFMTAVSIGTITLLTFAIAGMALATGTIFPQFDTASAAQIPTSFGGLIFMMASVSLIGIVIVIEARPVYTYLSAGAFGTPADAAGMVVGFGAAALLCVAATLLPIRLATKRLTALER